MGIQSSILTVVKALHPLSSWWTCELSTGRILSERTAIWDMRAGGLRALDWSLDLVSAGDILKIKTVSLHCPDERVVTFLIEEPGTVFQLKIATMHMLVAGKQEECQLIGKVIDKVSGACTCAVWDRQDGLIEYASNVYAFGTWRPGILPLGKLSLDVLGLRLS